MAAEWRAQWAKALTVGECQVGDPTGSQMIQVTFYMFGSIAELKAQCFAETLAGSLKEQNNKIILSSNV